MNVFVRINVKEILLKLYFIELIERFIERISTMKYVTLQRSIYQKR